MIGRFLPAVAIGLVSAIAASPAGAHPAVTQRAAAILEATGVQGGLVVHVGCGDGKLTAALGWRDGFLAQGLDRNPGDVDRARAQVRSQGVYGPVSIDHWSGTGLPYIDGAVNLLIVDDAAALDATEVLRALAPGGVAYLADGPQADDAEWAEPGKSRPEQRIVDGAVVITKPWPDEIDEWTHYLHDSTGNAVANDRVVGPPRHYQWIAEPRWARSHDHLSTTSALVSSGGRVFYIIDEAPTALAAIAPEWKLVARDAFSGVLLWKRPIGPWEGHLRGFRTGPTELARRLVAVGDRVYVTLGYGEPISALDAATGQTVATYERTTNALEFVHRDGVIHAVIGDRLPDNTAGAAKPSGDFKTWLHWPIYRETPPKKHLVAVRVRPSPRPPGEGPGKDSPSPLPPGEGQGEGAVLWTKDDADTHGLMPSTLAATDDRVFFHSGNEIIALDRTSGDELWRTQRAVNRRRPSWSAPTLVVVHGVVLCGDRKVDAVHPGADPDGDTPQWIVSSQGGIAPEGTLDAFDAATGRRLWQAPCREVYNAPVDVLVTDGRVWSGRLVRSREPGITRALDLTTGEVAFERPADQEFFKIVMGHHRCYRNKATERFLVLGRDGTELIDVDTGKGYGNAWFRGACQYGVMPCNGLIYSPPHSCACHIEWKTNSFIALAPARGDGQPARDNRQPDGDETRETPAPGAPVSDAAWPMYRHDIERSGATSMRLGPVSGSADDAGRVVPLKQAWSTDVGSPATQPVVGHGRVIVATPETHTVHALDAGSGEPRWTFTAGSRVDSSPTLYNGTVLFGSADGVIYCLDARDGARCWRQRVAPADRRLVAYDGIESVWPVSGSVLVLDGDVYAVAGRCAFVDGGLRFCRLDAATGSVLQTRTIPQPALPDVLSSDGESLFMRHLRMDKTGQPTAPNVRHLYSAAGFLDGSWWHRTYWQYGHQMQSNYGGWPVVGSRVPAGRLMAIGKKTIYGFGRLNQYDNVGSHVGLGHTEYRLFATARPPRQAKPMQRRKRRYANDVSSRWSREVPVLVRGMVLCDEVLFIAGPPDVTVTSPPNVKDPYHVASAKALAEQRAALEGKRGARLLAIAVDDGTTLAEVNLGACSGGGVGGCSGGIVAGPTWDGLSAAEGKLLLATLDGHVVCLAPH